MSQTPTELDRIIDKFCIDLKKRINAQIQRQEKRLVKEISIANKTSKKPVKKDTHRRSSSTSSGSSSS